jgi:hypothetical protein
MSRIAPSFNGGLLCASAALAVSASNDAITPDKIVLTLPLLMRLYSSEIVVA